jgi:hypothetical protein
METHPRVNTFSNEVLPHAPSPLEFRNVSYSQVLLSCINKPPQCGGLMLHPL